MRRKTLFSTLFAVGIFAMLVLVCPGKWLYTQSNAAEYVEGFDENKHGDEKRSNAEVETYIINGVEGFVDYGQDDESKELVFGINRYPDQEANGIMITLFEDVVLTPISSTVDRIPNTANTFLEQSGINLKKWVSTVREGILIGTGQKSFMQYSKEELAWQMMYIAEESIEEALIPNRWFNLFPYLDATVNDAKNSVKRFVNLATSKIEEYENRDTGERRLVVFPAESKRNGDDVSASVQKLEQDNWVVVTDSSENHKSTKKIFDQTSGDQKQAAVENNNPDDGVTTSGNSFTFYIDDSPVKITTSTVAPEIGSVIRVFGIPQRDYVINQWAEWTPISGMYPLSGDEIFDWREFFEFTIKDDGNWSAKGSTVRGWELNIWDKTEQEQYYVYWDINGFH